MTSPATRLKPASVRVLVHVLSGCWREAPGSCSLEAGELTQLLPALIGSGAGALAWRRLRDSTLSRNEVALTLRNVHLRQALDTKLQEQEILRLLEKLRSVGVEPLLVKGWATARLYPEAGLRALGDIDLLVRPADKVITERVLGVQVDEGLDSRWDIKSQVPALYQVDTETLFARAQRVSIGKNSISVLGAEDHLRVMCLHFLKHGAWRPLWLCDIAAALEFRSADFSWPTCLGNDARCADAVACALGLAHQLLGASVGGTPIEARAVNLPFWLGPAVLSAWALPRASQHQIEPLNPDALRARKKALRAVLQRWPNPIEAVMERGHSLSWPPLLAQTATFVARGHSFWNRVSRAEWNAKTHFLG